MTREEIILKLKNYFDIRELVSSSVFFKYGEDAWFIFDTNTLLCLLIIREGIGKPITINNWHTGGQFSQRGYRSNISEIVESKRNLYVSGHMIGKAFDFDVKGMTADQVRTWIHSKADFFPCKVRLENKNLLTSKTINWVHFDICHYDRNPKVYLFNI